MSRFYSQSEGHYLLSGDTFPVKEELKQSGAKWNATRKQWAITATSTTRAFLEKLSFFELRTEEITTVAATSAVESVTSLGKTWTVTEVVELIQKAVLRTFPDQVWITGEISSYKQSSGHTYFELSEGSKTQLLATSGKFSLDKPVTLNCALWSGKRKQLEQEKGELMLAEGHEVRLLVSVEFRKEAGRISLIVTDLDAGYALGKMALQRAEIVRELRKRGLYGLNKRTFFSPFPLQVALITADSSRAKSDFLDELTQSGVSFSVTLFDCHMQGEKTSAEVVLALKEIEKRSEKFAVVVITRGGGSRLDLRWFDDLEIGKAISYCALPVITAIGHFEDVSVADEVAYHAEKTPTAAARFLVESVSQNLNILFNRFEKATIGVRKKLVQWHQLLERMQGQMANSVRARFVRENSRLDGYSQTLRILKAQLHSPLRRGFAILKLVEAEGKETLIGAQEFRNNPPENFWVELCDNKTSTRLKIRAKFLELFETTEPE